MSLPPPDEAGILFFKEDHNMDQISRFVIWLCAKFSREQLELIVKELSDILQGRKEFPVNPKDAFREKHPNYRAFYVDPNPPLTEPAKKKNKR